MTNPLFFRIHYSSQCSRYTSLAVSYYLISIIGMASCFSFPIITSLPSQHFVIVFQQGARIGLGLGLGFYQLKLSVLILVFFLVLFYMFGGLAFIVLYAKTGSPRL